MYANSGEAERHSWAQIVDTVSGRSDRNDPHKVAPPEFVEVLGVTWADINRGLGPQST